MKGKNKITKQKTNKQKKTLEILDVFGEWKQSGGSDGTGTNNEKDENKNGRNEKATKKDPVSSTEKKKRLKVLYSAAVVA